MKRLPHSSIRSCAEKVRSESRDVMKDLHNSVSDLVLTFLKFYKYNGYGIKELKTIRFG